MPKFEITAPFKIEIEAEDSDLACEKLFDILENNNETIKNWLWDQLATKQINQ